MTSEKSDAERIKPRRESAESKAETTRRIAREISQAEADVRDAKTARLKAARLAQQAAEKPPAVAAGRGRSAKTRSGK